MGDQGLFRDEINRIRKTADARNTIKDLQALRRQGIDSEAVPIGKYDQIHMMLRDAQKIAEERAFQSLDPQMQADIEQRVLLRKINNKRAEEGIAPLLDTRY